MNTAATVTAELAKALVTEETINAATAELTKVLVAKETINTATLAMTMDTGETINVATTDLAKATKKLSMLLLVNCQRCLLLKKLLLMLYCNNRTVYSILGQFSTITQE